MESESPIFQKASRILDLSFDPPTVMIIIGTLDEQTRTLLQGHNYHLVEVTSVTEALHKDTWQFLQNAQALVNRGGWSAKPNDPLVPVAYVIPKDVLDEARQSTTRIFDIDAFTHVFARNCQYCSVIWGQDA